MIVTSETAHPHGYPLVLVFILPFVKLHHVIHYLRPRRLQVTD